MTKRTKNKKSRFDGISLNTLNEDVAKVTGKVPNSNEEKLELSKDTKKRGKGSFKSVNSYNSYHLQVNQI